ILTLGSGDSADEIARNLFKVLREMDDNGIEVIYSEEFSIPGLGAAIMNRLVRAAGRKIIDAELSS
ncbi:MAG: translation factor (SUA5), partial [Lachnospiraceae bacterium]|nr:translation factor (SUA5) [Lachnospiraceae bacterium]